MQKIKIGIIGEKLDIEPFLAAGITEITEEDVGAFSVVFVMENVAHQYEQLINEYKDYLTPAITILPTQKGESMGSRIITQAVKRAVGAEIA